MVSFMGPFTVLPDSIRDEQVSWERSSSTAGHCRRHCHWPNSNPTTSLGVRKSVVVVWGSLSEHFEEGLESSPSWIRFQTPHLSKAKENTSFAAQRSEEGVYQIHGAKWKSLTLAKQRNDRRRFRIVFILQILVAETTKIHER